MRRNALIVFAVPIAVALAVGAGSARAFDHVKWPDGRRVRVVQANPQIDLSSLRSGVAGHATDRRFETNAGMYLANELYLSGTEFFLRASQRKLPIANDREFSFITNVEAYWYSRYNLIAVSARSRLGIGVVHGPYLDLLARESRELNRFGRGRGELAPSNKDILLTKVIASYLGRTGMPQKFDNAVPLMLEFKSGDPHFTVPIDLDIEGTDRARYLDDFETMRWSHDRMEKTIDMGGVAQAMLKKVLWAKFFLRRNHQDEDFPGEIFLGNNAEDGLRGAGLTLQAVSTMLIAKAALFCDPARSDLRLSWPPRSLRLGGIDPVAYEPAAGVRYLPHEIRPTLIYMSDMPVRHYDFAVKDPTSHLWDQASWLWATTEFFHYANPRRRDNWDQVFGYQTPYDGSVMEQKYALLAQGLAQTVLANLEAMHLVDGVLVSSWTPSGGTGDAVAVADLALSIVALANFAARMDLAPERQARARVLVRDQADFLLRVSGKDGSYRESYEVPSGIPQGRRDMTSQAFAIRALLTAYETTKDERYLAAAQRTSATWNRLFWDPSAWLYRNEPGKDEVVYTPRDVAAALGALREMVLIGGDLELLERFKRFFVQSVDASGLMQSEDRYTGEDLDQVRAGVADGDGDGIPFLSEGDGPHGVDSVFASRVAFDLSSLPERGEEVQSARTGPTSGREVFETNCAVCHGLGGVGNEGPRLIANPFVQLTGRAAVMRLVAHGRVSVGMPAWDGILSDDEIMRVVDYVRSLEEEAPEPSRPLTDR